MLVTKKEIIEVLEDKPIFLFMSFVFIISIIFNFMFLFTKSRISDEDLSSILTFLYSDFFIFFSLIIPISLAIVTYTRKEFHIESKELIKDLKLNMILALSLPMFSIFYKFILSKPVNQPEPYIIVSFLLAYLFTFIFFLIDFIRNIIEEIDPKKVFQKYLKKNNNFEGDSLNIAKFAIRNKDLNLLRYLLIKSNIFYYKDFNNKKKKDDLEHFYHSIIEYCFIYGDENSLKEILIRYFKFLNLIIKYSKHEISLSNKDSYGDSLNFYYFKIQELNFKFALRMYEDEYLILMENAIKNKNLKFFEFADNFFDILFYRIGDDQRVNLNFVKGIIFNYAKSSEFLIKTNCNQKSVQCLATVRDQFIPYLNKLDPKEKNDLSLISTILVYKETLPLIFDYNTCDWDRYSLEKYYISTLIQLIESLEDDYPGELLELKNLILDLYKYTLKSNFEKHEKNILIGYYLSYFSRFIKFYFKWEGAFIFEVNEFIDKLEKKHREKFVQEYLTPLIIKKVSTLDKKNKDDLKCIKYYLNYLESLVKEKNT